MTKRDGIIKFDHVLAVVVVIFFSILLLISSLLIPAIAQGTVHLTGKLGDQSGRQFTVLNRKNKVEYSPVVLSRITTTSEGNFQSSFPLSETTFVEIEHNGERLMMIWIEPGDSMAVTIPKLWNDDLNAIASSADREHILFSGDNDWFNNYLMASRISIEDRLYLKALTTTPQQFSNYLDSAVATELQSREKINEKLSMLQREFLVGEKEYLFKYYKTIYEGARARNKVKDSVNYNLPIWNDWQFLTDDALLSPSYRHALSGYFNYKARLQTGGPKNDKQRENFFAAAFRSLDLELRRLPQSREFGMAYFLYHMLQFVDAADSVKVLSSVFDKNFPDSPYQGGIKKRLTIKTRMREPAPEIVAQDVVNMPFRIGEFKGKVVYIDIWASWCGPCLGEFPKSKILSEKFKDEKVTFVYLNIDDSDQAWKKIITRTKLSGTHIRADKEGSAKIKEAYGISAIPRYLLIDQKGNLISGNAKRPSEIEEDIRRLLLTGTSGN